MIVRIREEAETDLEAFFDWYERQRVGLGQDFLDEFIRGTRKIAESPHSWPLAPESKLARRYRLDPFPYSLVYRIEETHCMIVAVVSLLREPGYWLDRLSDK